MRVLLLLSVFVIATCGLVYELVAGTLASYLLGDTVTQFSTVIGVYLFSMGIGSWFSKFIRKDLIAFFIRVELLIGIIGGFSGATLFFVFAWASAFRIVLYGLVGLTGLLVGLEIPILMRVMKDEFDFSELVSRVFTFDYIGALAASILFPIFLVPHLGLIRTSLLFGILNVAVAFLAISSFRATLRSPMSFRVAGIAVLLIQLAGFIWADSIQKFSEQGIYPGRIVYSTQSPYQRIILTKQKDDLRLYLNGHLQFSSRDEYRYHEALVHPGLTALKKPAKVLVMGGGDGMALREIFKHPEVDSVLLVDLDPEMTRLFRNNAMLKSLNGDVFSRSDVSIVNADAFSWIRESKDTFSFVTIDFPDPGNYSLGKLYSLSFYHELYRVLEKEGIAVIQSTSPLAAPKSFWCVEKTLREAGFFTFPYHVYVPSFGEWGFILASRSPIQLNENFPKDLRFLNPSSFSQMKYFPPDMAWVETDVNRLNNQSLVHYFEDEWSRYEEY